MKISTLLLLVYPKFPVLDREVDDHSLFSVSRLDVERTYIYVGECEEGMV